jgi:hypothetical protein
MGGYEVDRRRPLDFLGRRVLIWHVPLSLCLGAVSEGNDARAYRFDPPRNTTLGQYLEAAESSCN